MKTWMDNKLYYKFRNAVYGAVVGDALGVPYEFMERGSFVCSGMRGHGTHDQPAGTWSDDSSMLLATCMSLRDTKGKVDIEDIRNNFLAWMKLGAFSPFGEVFDIGSTTAYALQECKGKTDLHSNGNGSLMRILPLAFTDCTEEEIREVSAITHAHRISKDACVIYVNLIRSCLRGETLFDAVHDLRLSEPFERLCRIDALPEDEIKSSGYVVDTLEAAIWCVLTSESFEQCLLKAVNLGTDTDTTACVAGGMAGACRWDIDELPTEWITKIQNPEVIRQCLGEEME